MGFTPWATTPSLDKIQIGSTTRYLKDSEARVQIENLWNAQAAGLQISIADTDPTGWTQTAMQEHMGQLILYPDSTAVISGTYIEYVVLFDDTKPAGSKYSVEKIGTTQTDLSDYLPTTATVAGVAFGSGKAVATDSLKTALGLKALAYKSQLSLSTSTSISVVTSTKGSTATFTGSYDKATGVNGNVSVTPNTTSLKVGNVTGVTPTTANYKLGDVTGVTQSTASLYAGNVTDVVALTKSVKIGDVTGVTAVNTNYTVGTGVSKQTANVCGSGAVTATVDGETLVISTVANVAVVTGVSLQTTSIAAATSVSVTKQGTGTAVATGVSVTTQTNATTIVTNVEATKQTTNTTLVTGIAVATQTNGTTVMTGVATATFTGSISNTATQVSVSGSYNAPTAPTNVTVSVASTLS